MLAVVAALLTGCESVAEPAAHTDAPASAVEKPDPKPDAVATLASLRRVDDHPLWTMTYRGGYDPLRGVKLPAKRKPYGCSLFVASGDPDNPVFARNFDWDPHPALLLFTDPPDGHASVSLVDVSYLGVESDADFRSAAGKRKLLDAPLLPFDGMNEKGLAVGLAAVPSADGVPGSRPTVGSVRILRLVLDEAGTVDEALRVFRRYNIDFDGGPPLHYLVADAHGDSAVVEFVDGKVVAVPGGGSWNAAVNFTLTGTGDVERQEDDRYRTASTALREAGGKLDWRAAMNVLSDVAQGHTQWSVVYGQRSGDIRLTTGKRFDTVHRFQLEMDN